MFFMIGLPWLKFMTPRATLSVRLCSSINLWRGTSAQEHIDVARQSRNQNPSRELRESSVAAVYDRRRCRAHGSPAVIDRRYSRFRVIRGQQTCQKKQEV